MDENQKNIEILKSLSLPELVNPEYDVLRIPVFQNKEDKKKILGEVIIKGIHSGKLSYTLKKYDKSMKFEVYVRDIYLSATSPHINPILGEKERRRGVFCHGNFSDQTCLDAGYWSFKANPVSSNWYRLNGQMIQGQLHEVGAAYFHHKSGAAYQSTDPIPQTLGLHTLFLRNGEGKLTAKIIVGQDGYIEKVAQSDGYEKGVKEIQEYAAFLKKDPLTQMNIDRQELRNKSRNLPDQLRKMAFIVSVLGQLNDDPKTLKTVKSIEQTAWNVEKNIFGYSSVRADRLSSEAKMTRKKQEKELFSNPLNTSEMIREEFEQAKCTQAKLLKKHLPNIKNIKNVTLAMGKMKGIDNSKEIESIQIAKSYVKKWSKLSLKSEKERE